MNEQQLPQLPEPDHSLDCGEQPFYRPDQMQAYARAALAMSPKPASGTSEQQERKEFERWASDGWTSPLAVLKDSDGIYKLMSVQQQWRAWQARAALAANVPADFRSHRRAWRNAIELAKQHAPMPREDEDDKAYWEHELHAFDLAFAEMESAAPAPAPEADAWRNRWPSTAAVHPDAPAQAQQSTKPTAAAPERCQCGYLMPCSKTVPVGFCRSHVKEKP